MKRKILLSTLVIFIVWLGTWMFFHKTQLNFNLVCTIENNVNFHPDAYVVINSKEKLEDFLFLNNQIKKHCNDFNLSKYSYVIVYGKKVKSMYHSYKSTYFDDKSASYAQCSGVKVLFIEYVTNTQNSGMFVYKINRDDNLRGFYGI